jgi:Tol biopolymer transport system component
MASVPRFASLIVVSGLLVISGIGCSSSQPKTPTPQDASPEPKSTLSLLYTTADAGLVLYDARRDTSRTLVTGVDAGEARAVSPTGRYLAFTYATADSSHLGLLDLTTQTLQRVHAIAGTATYSLAWHPDQDRLAFGHYRPVENGTRGPGGIRVATPRGTTRDVGCSAAREVLHWLPNGTLATRTDEKLYVVATEDCATQASLDARRMHLIHYAPDGRQMAYIHRELRYDREAGDYVPDSSLVLSGPQGENAKTLFKDKRHARHLRWAPDGSELALDVAVQESGRRQLVVYDGNRPTFLISPEQTTADQTRPRWSPSGSRLAFALRTTESAYAAVRVKGQTRRLGPVDGAVWGWLDDRSVVVPGPDSVRVQTLNGTTRFAHPAPVTLLHVWRTPIS